MLSEQIQNTTLSESLQLLWWKARRRGGIWRRCMDGRRRGLFVKIVTVLPVVAKIIHVRL